MKKLFIYLSLPLLIAANQTVAQTQQSVVNEILAKTEYKNVYGFLNAIAVPDNTILSSDLFKDESVKLQQYLNKAKIKYAPVEWRLRCFLSEPNTRTDDTLYCCYESISLTPWCFDYFNNLDEVVGNGFLLDNQSLLLLSEQKGITGSAGGKDVVLSDEKKAEIEFFQILFCREDTSIMFGGSKIYIEYNNAHANLKEELIDNDLQGRMLVTNLSKTDSAFYSINGGTTWQELPLYVLFDKATDITIKNYYKGCSDSVTFVKDSATEMPRIHDTVVEYVKDTIYITKTDTVYIEKTPDKTAINAKQVNLNVWPNPATTFVNAEAEEPFSYTLLNNAGVVLKKESGEPSYTISMSEYPDGVYYITTSDGAIHKIVKE
ncbi:MAG: T9SS type A sorting domain-containing protein [Salinivirgaceae bacterium]|nr:T9SS type A sorting domain-containing protein [Salinivirgaceae bacterium]